MDGDFDMTDLALTKFGIGQPVTRMEDPILVRGEGLYTDDVNLPDQAYAAIVRSNIAHGVLKGIEVEAARGMPGVLGVYLAADIEAAGFGQMPAGMAVPGRDDTQMKRPQRFALAADKVRYVGDPIRLCRRRDRPHRRRTRPRR